MIRWIAVALALSMAPAAWAEPQDLETRAYDVSDLLAAVRKTGGEPEVEEIVDILYSLAIPVGGFHDDEYVEAAEETITVHDTAAAHEAAARLLDALRKRGKVDPPPLPEWRRALDEKLNSPVSCDFQSADISTLTAFLAEKLGVPVRIDESLAAEFDGVSVRLKEAPTRALLACFVEAAGGIADPRESGVVVTSRPTLTTRVFEVRNLLRRGRGREYWRSEDELVDMLITGSNEEAWGLEDCSIAPWNELLLVRQTEPVLKSCERLLRVLRTATAPHMGDATKLRVFDSDPPGRRSEELLRRLRTHSVSVKVEDGDMQDVLDSLTESAKVNVVLSPCLQEDSDELYVTLVLDRVSASDVLDLLCAQTWTEWAVEGGVVRIGEQGELAGWGFRRVYDVRSILEPELAELRSSDEFLDGLHAILTPTTDDDERTRVGYWDGAFLIDSSLAAHRTVVRTLDGLRSRGTSPAAVPAWREALERKLDTRFTLTVTDLDPAAAVAKLGKMFQLNLVLDPEVGDDETTVTVDVRGMPAREVLLDVARQIEAHLEFRNGAACLSFSPEARIRIYDVRDILRRKGPEGNAPSASLISERRGALLVRAGELWDEAEGGGDPWVWNDMLVFYQPEVVHSALEKHLAALRSGK